MPDRKPTRQTRDKAEPQTASTSVRACGVLALGCSICAALLLSLGSLFEIAPPGCGPASSCAQAAAGPFGRVPGIDWPVSLIGLAYFTATLAAWLSTRGSASAALRAVVRCAVLVSLAFVAILLIERTFCAYCLAAHAGHLVFWLALERGARPAHASPRPLIAMTLVFVLITGMLVPLHASQRRAVRNRAEKELAESTAEIIAATAERSANNRREHHETARDTGPTVATPMAGGRFQELQSAGPVEILHAATLTAKPVSPGFGSLSGRRRLGPERAAIRMVVFSDYECRDCQRIEGEIRALLVSRSDLSVTARHFPMCSDCNPHMPDKMHPNACWAARAAEAAGILRGNDGFFEMHRWLFDRRGRFTDAELRQAARELGYDADEFVRVMMSERTLANVQADIEEAVELGLHFTPMIFVNGVELRGWQAREGVRRVVEAVARTNPPSMSAANDRPPRAADKYIADWLRQPVRALNDATDWQLGPDAALVDIVVFGDFREPHTAEADRLIRELVAAGEPVRYRYRHFPANKDCNPGVPTTRHPLACRAAQAAEAAGLLQGPDGYWRMHVWLFEQQHSFSEALLHDAAGGLGFEPQALRAVMGSSEVAAAILEDTRAGKRLGIRSLPTLYVNGRRVPRWRRDGERILERIVRRAAAEAGAGTQSRP